ncbi:hypothetical protein BC940DRAFT_310204 [Gongronella butleri]|nr:hypothetical protein BC940DRAFT_310204 [Gongronella butleri]
MVVLKNTVSSDQNHKIGKIRKRHETLVLLLQLFTPFLAFAFLFSLSLSLSLSLSAYFCFAFMYAIIFFCLCLTVVPSYGSIVFVSSNETFMDRPAVFGPSLDNRLIVGELALPSLAYGCDPVVPPTHDWIALVQRGGGCSFADKVRAMQESQAIAVIIGDPHFNGWITMYATGDTSDIRIPSVYVAQYQFNALKHLITEQPVRIGIFKDEDPAWTFMDMMTVVVLSPSIMMVLMYCTWKYREYKQQVRDLAPCHVVSNLPSRVFRREKSTPVAEQPPAMSSTSAHGALSSSSADGSRAGFKPLVPSVPPFLPESHAVAVISSVHNLSDARDSHASTSSTTTSVPMPCEQDEECAICLEEYLEGDCIRILPCQHEFHASCIDTWLTTRKKFCPICKYNICQGKPQSSTIQPSSSQEEQQPPTTEPGITEQTPLLPC